MNLIRVLALVVISAPSSMQFVPSPRSKPRSKGLKAETTKEIESPMEKGERFVKWMQSDSLEEVNHPGKCLAVQGSIPPYLGGSYIKNGPGAFGTSSRRYTHIFDGLAKLIKFDFGDGGEVIFTSSFIDTQWKRAVLDRGVLPPSVTIGPVSPDWNVFERIWAALTSLSFDNTPVNVHRISDEDGPFIAVTDAPVTMQFDASTLQTRSRVHYPSKIDGFQGFPLFSTAHPHQWRGQSFNYYLEVTPFGVIAHIVLIRPDFTRQSVGSVPIQLGQGLIPYVHDFSITDTGYAILCIYPVQIPMLSLFTGAFMPQLQFDFSKSTKIYVFDLHHPSSGTKPPMATFETQPMFAYHHVNAYQDAETQQIVLDILAYEDPAIANSPHAFLYLPNMKTFEDRKKQIRTGNVWRFHLDMEDYDPSSLNFVKPIKTALVDIDTKQPFGMELPTISPNCQGKPYRYCYGYNGHHKGMQDFLDWEIVKQDMVDGEFKVWHEEYSYPGEPIFVPNPEGIWEDDGVLLNCVYDSKREENYLLVLDAVTMTEVARAYTGLAMPSGFHGKFFPSK